MAEDGGGNGDRAEEERPEGNDEEALEPGVVAGACGEAMDCSASTQADQNPKCEDDPGGATEVEGGAAVAESDGLGKFAGRERAEGMGGGGEQQGKRSRGARD